MLFLTEILGAEVIDVRQRRAGTVRDVTVRVQEPYPVVTGLVTSRRGELVIPWSRVRSFAAATREVALRTSREEVEHYQADPRDVWLARDVLDKQVVDTDGRRVVRVNDLQLAESGGSMLLGRVIKNNGAILTANVGTLPIPRRRIVIRPENFQ